MEEQASPPGPAPSAAPKGRAIWIVVAALVVVIVVVLAAAVYGLFSPTTPAKPSLKIGVLLSITGALSQYGPGDTKGAQLAAEQINAAGGVLGQPITIVTEDDQTDSLAASGATTKLINQNHVNVIVGAQFSGGTIPSISIAKAAGVPMMSPSATSPALSNLTLTGGYFFRTAPSDALQGVVAANYLYTNLSFRWVNILARDDSYGRGLAGVVTSRFTALGGHVNHTEIIDPKGTNFVPNLDTLFNTNPQVVYFVGFPGEGLPVMTQWQSGLSSKPSYNRPWIFSEGLKSQAFMDQLRAPSVGVDVTKIRGTAPVSPFGPIYEAFRSQYKARFFNQEPVLYADYTYDCVYLYALAAQKSGSVNGTAIKNALRSVTTTGVGTVIKPGEWSKALTELAAGRNVNWEGAAGSEDFDANGDVRGSYEVWGVNSTFQLYRIAFIPESTITTSSLGASSAAPTATVSRSFVSMVQSAAVSRRY